MENSQHLISTEDRAQLSVDLVSTNQSMMANEQEDDLNVPDLTLALPPLAIGLDTGAVGDITSEVINDDSSDEEEELTPEERVSAMRVTVSHYGYRYGIDRDFLMGFYLRVLLDQNVLEESEMRQMFVEEINDKVGEWVIGNVDLGSRVQTPYVPNDNKETNQETIKEVPAVNRNVQDITLENKIREILEVPAEIKLVTTAKLKFGLTEGQKVKVIDWANETNLDLDRLSNIPEPQNRNLTLLYFLSNKKERKVSRLLTESDKADGKEIISYFA